MKKKPAFPNECFKTQNDYFNFVDKYHVFGGEAYILKKKLDKEIHSLNKKVAYLP